MLVSATTAVLVASVTIVLPAPAGAQAEPCPPGQPTGRPPGQPPGPGAPPGQPPGRPPQYPPGKCQLRLSRSVVAAGESVGVAGEGFAPGGEVRVAAAGVGLANLSAGSGGSFSTNVVIPEALAGGTHSVTASGPAAGGGTQVLSASLTVTGARSGGAGAAGAQEGDALPRTGAAGITALAALGLALTGLGASAVAATRRRRSSRSA